MDPLLPSLAPAALLAADEGPRVLWEWIERHATIVYPAIAILIVGLIVGALFASWKADDVSAERRGELKMRIMQVMRRRISGVSADTIAAELQIDLMLAARLLSELDQEGFVSASGLQPIQYRLRGNG